MIVRMVLMAALKHNYYGKRKLQNWQFYFYCSHVEIQLESLKIKIPKSLSKFSRFVLFFYFAFEKWYSLVVDAVNSCLFL